MPKVGLYCPLVAGREARGRGLLRHPPLQAKGQVLRELPTRGPAGSLVRPTCECHPTGSGSAGRWVGSLVALAQDAESIGITEVSLPPGPHSFLCSLHWHAVATGQAQLSARP